MFMLLLACALKGPLPVGTWAGPGQTLVITETGGSLDGACGGMTLDAPLALDLEEGKHLSTGTWEQRQGNINEFDDGRSFPARLEGQATARRFQGTLIINSFPESVQEVDVRKGAEPALGECVAP